MRKILFSLLLVIACGKNGTHSPQSQKKTSIEELEGNRVVDISRNSGNESSDLKYPLVTQAGVLKLLNDIQHKLQAGTEADSIESLIWFMLEGVHLNWANESKDEVIKRLQLLGSWDDSLKEKLDIFLESEGLKESSIKISELNNEIKSNDPNRKNILERRLLKGIEIHLSSKENFNLYLPQSNETELFKKALRGRLHSAIKSQSIGSPVEVLFPETGFKLPHMEWKGTAYSESAGTRTIEGTYNAGLRHGAGKDYGGCCGGANGHSFVTSSFATQENAFSLNHIISVQLEVKGGGKRTRTGGFKNKTSSASFSFKGKMTIPGCDDLTQCSPFITVTPKEKDNSSRVEFFVDGQKLELNKTHLVDRTRGPVQIIIHFSGSANHRGKSGAIRRDYSFDLEIKQQSSSKMKLDILALSSPQSFLVQHEWLKTFEEELKKIILTGDPGSHIFRHLMYLDIVLHKKNLTPSQLTMIKTLNSAFLLKAHEYYYPLIKKIIEEKKRTLQRLPLQYLSKIFEELKDQDFEQSLIITNNQKILELLENDEELLKRTGIDLELLSTLNKSTIVALYKKLATSFDDMINELNAEKDFLQEQAAQLDHMFFATTMEVVHE